MLEAFFGNSLPMDEDVRSLFSADESVSKLFIEPVYSTLFSHP